MMQNRTSYSRRAVTIVAAAAALALAGCKGPPPSTGIACHGRAGEGRAPTFPPLAGSEWLDLGPDATALIVIHGLKGEIQVAGKTYRGYMPPMNQVRDADVAAILGYIGARWAEGWTDADDVARVTQLRAHGEDQNIIIGLEDLEARLQALPPRNAP